MAREPVPMEPPWPALLPALTVMDREGTSGEHWIWVAPAPPTPPEAVASSVPVKVAGCTPKSRVPKFTPEVPAPGAPEMMQPACRVIWALSWPDMEPEAKTLEEASSAAADRVATAIFETLRIV